jgi:hypothetical protein
MHAYTRSLILIGLLVQTRDLKLDLASEKDRQKQLTGTMTLIGSVGLVMESASSTHLEPDIVKTTEDDIELTPTSRNAPEAEEHVSRL